METAQPSRPAEHSASLNAELADRVLPHLDLEESTLIEMREAVREVRQALVARDPEFLAKALEKEVQHLRQGEMMRERRRQLRCGVANSLGVSPDLVTLGKLFDCTEGDVRESIGQARQRLAEMTAEIGRLNRQNAAMIRQSLDITRAILGQLTGLVPDADCYNEGGGREEVRIGPVVQWGG